MTARYQLLDRGVFDFQSRTNVLPDSPDWQTYREWLTAGGIPLPPDTVGQMDLPQAQAEREAQIETYATGLRNKVISGVSAGEMASWLLKLMDGLAVRAGQPSPFAPILPAIGAGLGLPATPTSYNHAIALVRGISEAEHIDKVLPLATQFLTAEAAIDGVRGKHVDAVRAITDMGALLAYDWMAGWPAL